MDQSYLIIDSELKQLLGSLASHHPDNAKSALKLIVKLYLKLLDASKRKGHDPLMVFQDLMERVTSGQIYRTTQDKINALDEILSQNSNSPAVGSPLASKEVMAELREVKSMLRELRTSSWSASVATGGSAQYSPKSAAELVTVEKSSEPKQRKSYRDLRQANKNKKISF